MPDAAHQTHHGAAPSRLAGRQFSQVISAVVVPGVLLAAWEIAVRADILPSTLIAAPSQVVANFLRMCADMTLITHTLVSLRRLAIGFALGTTLGITFGAIVGASRTVGRLFEPTILALIPIPSIAWIPLLIILFGIGESSKVFLISIGGFCTLFIPSAYGTVLRWSPPS